ncbi:alanine racemase [Pacificitalea manganoxidans]|uniref:Alanine racemase n=1 Tax=Pacificitalea manganoxidans TaxID=1411902 RepID=A0A291LYV3_9RHOB|nr:alanine racemase [Pacificitalea manganoxidans]ATI41834.1 alanine racemase [Pacificitalea manganoxidans]MDR6309308.1 alanine racemase [Pacificitalea manganoxidans]
MATGTLTIDLDALAHNWRALDRMSGPDTETGAVVKADGYGLGAETVARVLAKAGARRFFVAVAEEGAAIRAALGRAPEIYVFGGHMPGDTEMIHDLDLIPLLNSIEQMTRHFEALPDGPFGVQLDTNMNRLGLELAEWAAVGEIALSKQPRLLMSHLASADDPDSDQSARQLETFRHMTDGTGVARSLSATGGTLLGRDYHFELTRPGVGLYGGLPFEDARPVARVTLPVIQTRTVEAGEQVGYNATWTAPRDSLIATVSGGYADGIHRAMSNRGALYAGDRACPIVGRVSMDLITVDVTDLPEVPDALDLLSLQQTVDQLAAHWGTTGYEVLTSLGARYQRRTVGTGPV